MPSFRPFGAIALLMIVSFAVASVPDDEPASDEPSTESAPPVPAPVEAPTRTDELALAAELALLEQAASRNVVVPPDATTLRELLASLTAQAGIPVEADWDALALLEIRPEDAPPLARGEGSVLSVLDALCVSMGVPYGRPRAEAILGRMRIVTPDTAVTLRRTRAYQADQLADDFLSQASEHVDPEGWVRNGGETQHATRIEGTLLVSAPASIHRRLDALLDELRLTRPMAVELAAELVRVPTASLHERLLDSSTPAPLRLSDLVAMPNAARVISPVLVAVIDQDARVETTAGGVSVKMSFRPERDPERGTLVRFELMVEVNGATTTSQGTIPAPLVTEPAIVSVDLPGTEESIVMLLRSRPLSRRPSASAP